MGRGAERLNGEGILGDVLYYIGERGKGFVSVNLLAVTL